MGSPTTSTSTPPQLTPQDWRILSYIDQRYWETGSIPTAEKTAQDLQIPPVEISKLYGNQTEKSKVFIKSLQARGIDITRLEDPDYVDKKLLTPKQILLANLLMNPLDKQTTRQKLELAQVSQQQYNAWMNDPIFTDYLTKRAKALFGASDHKALMALQQKMEKGDLRAIQLFLEMRDLYTPKKTLSIDVNLLLTKVVEIVAKYVEPQTLLAVSNELSALDPTSQTALSPGQTPQEAVSHELPPVEVTTSKPKRSAPRTAPTNRYTGDSVGF